MEFGNLQHYYAWLKENENSKKLIKLLKVVQFNQAIIYVNSKKLTHGLAKFLSDQDLPVLQIDTKVAHNDRSANCQDFKDNKKVSDKAALNLIETDSFSISSAFLSQRACSVGEWTLTELTS